jgi:GT2 family glycosyltransferase
MAGEVFSYHGACGLVSVDLMHRLGGWDPLVNFGGDEVDVALQAHLLGYRFLTVPNLVAVHPFNPRGGGKSGPLRRMRLRSTWFSLLKHAGITIPYGALGHEGVHHLFWNRLIADPRELGASAAWLVTIAPNLAERREGLRSLVRSTATT